MGVSKIQASGTEWFTQPDSPGAGEGLRFQCTMCGHCCSGPPGFVLVSDAEIAALARRLGVTPAEFERRYTTMAAEGRSLIETPSAHGLDCVFLDRQSVPGKAVCGVYEDRPRQCRTWPFWPSVVRSRQTWEQAKRMCPGMDTGPMTAVHQIRVLRDSFRI